MSAPYPVRIAIAAAFRPDQQERALQACPADLDLRFVDPAAPCVSPLEDVEVLVVGTQPVGRDIVDACPKLRLIQRWGTGSDNIDLGLMAERGIIVAELPGANSRSVAEFILLAMLAQLRQLPDMIVEWSRGRWSAHPSPRPKRCLTGKIVGLLGFGAIGQDLAHLLSPFDVRLLCHDRSPLAWNGPVEFVDKSVLLEQADIVSVQLPLNASTRLAIGAPELRLMKPLSILISVSRAEVVDEQAVRMAVAEGRLAAASFDNFSQEPLQPHAIFHAGHILATPHVGGACEEGFGPLLAACFSSIKEKLRR
jgi:phosphoglycerate dehydrogenase-like enzyme